MSNTILGYTPDQAEAVTFELQSTVMDLINLSSEEGAQAAIDLIVTGLSLRIAILEGLVTPEEAGELVTEKEGNFVEIVQTLQTKAILKLLGE